MRFVVLGYTAFDGTKHENTCQRRCATSFVVFDGNTTAAAAAAAVMKTCSVGACERIAEQ